MMLLSGPNIAGNEWQYVKECLDTGWVSSVGAYVTQFEKITAEFTGAQYAVACVNGTNALHIALLLNGVQPGDYVILPNITFIASCNAIKYSGASPIFIDVNGSDWQMDLDLLEEFLSTQTQPNDAGVCTAKKDGRVIRAIMPVHVLGNMGDMDKLMALAAQYNLAVVEDATEALGTYYKGKHAGTFGKMGCLSYNGNKIITTGGGGMIITDDEALAKQAKHLTTQAKTDPIEYIHDEIGYNYRLVNVLAAIGVAQMEQLPGFIQRKKEINAYYRQALGEIADIRFQQMHDDVDCNCWLFTFSSSRQKELLDHLNAKGLQSRPFWRPMNQLVMFKDDVFYHHNNVSDSVYRSALSIPCSTYLTNEDLDQVIAAIKEKY
jgi:aminotransferase in exopolysaccharide biosynthesis